MIKDGMHHYKKTEKKTYKVIISRDKRKLDKGAV